MAVLCMGYKRRALRASPPSDAVQCGTGKHRHAARVATPRMRRSPTAFSEIQMQKQVEILLIPGKRVAQCAFELRIALAAELRAELRDRRLVRGNLTHDEVRGSASFTASLESRGALGIIGRQSPTLVLGERLESLIGALVLAADPFRGGHEVRIAKYALRAAGIHDSLPRALDRQQHERRIVGGDVFAVEQRIGGML